VGGARRASERQSDEVAREDDIDNMNHAPATDIAQRPAREQKAERGEIVADIDVGACPEPQLASASAAGLTQLIGEPRERRARLV